MMYVEILSSAQMPLTLDLNMIQLHFERERAEVFPETFRLLQTKHRNPENLS